MYKVIMVPSDGSPAERPAITRAIRLAKFYGSELRLVRVSRSMIVIDALRPAFGDDSRQSFPDDQPTRDMSQLEALARRCRREGVASVRTVLLEGPPAATLASYASGGDVDLIVISSHSRGEAMRIVLGSVTDYLIRSTEVPVLVVKKPRLLGRDENAMHSILVPLDGSSLAEEILPQVAALAINPFTTVHLLQILTPLTYSQRRIQDPSLPWWENDFSAAQGYLEHSGAYFREHGIAVDSTVVLGNYPAEAIIDQAQQKRADLIAIATSGMGGLKRLILGSVTDEVVRKSSVSVLVLHPHTAHLRLGLHKAAELAVATR